MAMKCMTLLITLLVVVFVAQEANATVLVSVNGIVLCPVNNGSININITTNVTTPTLPRLPIVNARVEATILSIRVGASVTTDARGQFNLSFVQSVLTAIGNLLQIVTINVTPPPTACNSTLPPNTVLQSIQPLQLVSQSLLSVQLNVTGFKTILINI